MRKSYLGLAITVSLSLIFSGCDKSKEIESSNDKTVAPPSQAHTQVLAPEQEARLKMRSQIALCLQVSENTLSEPYERYIGDDVFDPKGINDNLEFVSVIKGLLLNEQAALERNIPITKDSLDYDNLISEKTHSNVLGRLLGKVAVDTEQIKSSISTDVFSRIFFEYNQGREINQNIEQCLSIYKNYSEDAYKYFVRTSKNPRVKPVGVQKIQANGYYQDEKGVKRQTWAFLTELGDVKITEKPFSLSVDSEDQRIPITNENWKNQNLEWANFDRLWVDQVFTNKVELYVVLSPDSKELGITPPVYFREVFVFSLDGKVRDRFSYKYPFELKQTEQIEVTPTGFISKTAESPKYGIYTASYENGLLRVDKFAPTRPLGATTNKCTSLFESVYVNEVDFKKGLKYGVIPEIPEKYKAIISNRIVNDPKLEAEFYFEVSNKSLVDKLNEPKGWFENKYCD